MTIRIVFGLIAALGLLMALGTVLARNLVHAALYLVGFFFLIACQFILLEADFLAAIQVLVYVGAVTILLLFGIMLTRNVQGDETTTVPLVGKLVGGAVALGVLAVLGFGILGDRGVPGRAPWGDVATRPEVARPELVDPATRPGAINNMGVAVGDQMMTRYVVAFEVAGLLLTAALVGAIALAWEDGPTETPRRGASATIPAGAPLGPGHGDGSGNGDGGGNGNGDGHVGPEPATTTTPTGAAR